MTSRTKADIHTHHEGDFSQLAVLRRELILLSQQKNLVFNRVINHYRKRVSPESLVFTHKSFATIAKRDEKNTWVDRVLKKLMALGLVKKHDSLDCYLWTTCPVHLSKWLAREQDSVWSCLLYVGPEKRDRMINGYLTSKFMVGAKKRVFMERLIQRPLPGIVITEKTTRGEYMINGVSRKPVAKTKSEKNKNAVSNSVFILRGTGGTYIDWKGIQIGAQKMGLVRNALVTRFHLSPEIQLSMEEVVGYPSVKKILKEIFPGIFQTDYVKKASRFADLLSPVLETMPGGVEGTIGDHSVKIMPSKDRLDQYLSLVNAVYPNNYYYSKHMLYHQRKVIPLVDRFQMLVEGFQKGLGMERQDMTIREIRNNPRLAMPAQEFMEASARDFNAKKLETAVNKAASQLGERQVFKLLDRGVLLFIYKSKKKAEDPPAVLTPNQIHQQKTESLFAHWRHLVFSGKLPNPATPSDISGVPCLVHLISQATGADIKTLSQSSTYWWSCLINETVWLKTTNERIRYIAKAATDGGGDALVLTHAKYPNIVFTGEKLPSGEVACTWTPTEVVKTDRAKIVDLVDILRKCTEQNPEQTYFTKEDLLKYPDVMYAIADLLRGPLVGTTYEIARKVNAHAAACQMPYLWERARDGEGVRFTGGKLVANTLHHETWGALWNGGSMISNLAMCIQLRRPITHKFRSQLIEYICKVPVQQEEEKEILKVNPHMDGF